tara:strand:+ start:778 stop:909 length:132 start_codon:yes stop_codon:yes gene_type:complete
VLSKGETSRKRKEGIEMKKIIATNFAWCMQTGVMIPVNMEEEE